MSVTIHSHRSFLVVDERGELSGSGELGFYAEDTRCLSSWRATLGGKPLVPFAAQPVRADESVHALTNATLPRLPLGNLSVERRHAISPHSWTETVTIRNFSGGTVDLPLSLRFRSDFAEIFEVKRAEHSGRSASARRRSKVNVRRSRREVVVQYAHGNTRRRTVLTFSRRPAELGKDRADFRIHLAHGAAWSLRTDVRGLVTKGGTATAPAEPPHGRPSLDGSADPREERYRAASPALDSDGRLLPRPYDRSIRDIASLRISGEGASEGAYAIAAGIPWYLALFGRDTLITAYQSLPFFPDLAEGSLLSLARLQGTKVDPVSAEEPGKILHEYRTGDLSSARRLIPKFPYYGTIDATPLFVIVLHEYWRWTADRRLVETLSPTLERALDWIDRYGDRDGDGYLEYLLERKPGLVNQGWKDSWDSVRFRDGRLAGGAIALCEVQGYAYDAKLRGAELSELLGLPLRAKRLRKEAAELRRRFNRDYWLEDRGTFAMALDGDKRKVDSLTSNAGQVLWSGIADVPKAKAVAEMLAGEAMFSGYGIRTMGKGEGGYNPISYHNGSVWPHDNALIAAGLARYGFRREAAMVIRGLLDVAAAAPDARFPELFAGFDRREFGIPVGIPTACRPQAWAAGSVLLFVQTLLGARPRTREGRLDLAPLALAGMNHLRIRGLHLGREKVTVVSDGHAARVEGGPFRRERSRRRSG